MKHRLPNISILCCASIFALSLASCSNNADRLKKDVNLTGNGYNESTGKIVKLRKGHRTNRLTGNFPDPRSYDNLWDRLFDHFDIPDVSHQDIDRELYWFINHPTYIDRVQSRAEPFLYSIVKQLEKQHMPGELALLPVIESAFQPQAVSPAHAAGIWQFIPATGHHYGLKHSYSYDGRRDIYASTRAAIKYLKKLHNEFNGDWLLAIAGYNCGEGAVARAIQRNNARGLPTDFWSLNLPQETRTYVPRLLAVAKLFSESEQYGISLRPIPNKALYKTVVLKDQVDLALAANAADISLDKLLELNPGFKRQKVDVNGSYRLFIPAHKRNVDFHQDLARQMAAQTYDDQASNLPVEGNATGKPADEDNRTPVPLTLTPAQNTDRPALEPTLSPPDAGVLAPIPTEEPVKVAEIPLTKTSLQVTKKPVPVQTAEFSLTADLLPNEPVEQPASKQPPTESPTASRDIRKKPEPLALAQLYSNDAPVESNISVASYEKIVTAARGRTSSRYAVKNIHKVQEEQAIKEPAKSVERETVKPIGRGEHTHARAGNKAELKNRGELPEEHRQIEQNPVGKKAAYVIHEGDTLNSIAHKYDMDLDDLKKINRVSDADDIKWGQSIKVVDKDTGKKLSGSKPTVSASKASNQSTKYTAHDGETLSSISRRFNVTVADLRKWNGVKVNKQFRAGTNITVVGQRD